MPRHGRQRVLLPAKLAVPGLRFRVVSQIWSDPDGEGKHLAWVVASPRPRIQFRFAR